MSALREGVSGVVRTRAGSAEGEQRADDRDGLDAHAQRAREGGGVGHTDFSREEREDEDGHGEGGSEQGGSCVCG